MRHTVAIILEWENVLQAGLERATEVLAELGGQARQHAQRSGAAVDLLVVYNPEDADSSIPRAILSDLEKNAPWPGSIEFVEAPGLHYFDQKNFGAARTEADIIVFFDSDVIPEEGWLPQVLAVFDDPAAMVVTGNSHLETRTIMEKCFSMVWFFPPKQPRPGVFETSNFYSNGVAFRREVFRKHSFPRADCYRGHGIELARELHKDGIKILRVGTAWTRHPWPGGMKYMTVRAFTRGYDAVFWSRWHRRGWVNSGPPGALCRFVRNYGVVLRRIVQRRRTLGLSVPIALLAAGVGWVYCTLVMVAEIVSFVSPQTVRRNFSI